MLPKLLLVAPGGGEPAWQVVVVLLVAWMAGCE